MAPNLYVFFFLLACFSALRSLIAVDLMGLEKLTNAFGILMLFQGLAAVVGSPIAGKNKFFFKFFPTFCFLCCQLKRHLLLFF